jgi:FkbM family methyltransferase
MDTKNIINRLVAEMTEMKKVIVNGEFEITLPDHRAARPEWYEPKGWEKPRLRHMSENIFSGDVMYYVGAEEGEFAALCQMWGAEVVVFEPNPKVWSHFPLLWSANNLDLPMVCIPGFASDKINNLSRIYYNEWPPEVNNVIEAAHGFKELYLEGESYGQITIDSCVYDHGIKPPTAISLDVEGSEWRVLGGAEKVLREHKPKIWLSGHPEFMLQQWNESLYNLRQWIKGLGYTEIILDYQHEVHLYYESI